MSGSLADAAAAATSFKDQALVNGLPPDLVIVVTAMTIFQVVDFGHRQFITPLFPTYKSLPINQRYEWDRRAFNLFFQHIQIFLNVYVLTWDTACVSDPLYGYSKFAHFSFLVIIGYYLVDVCALVMHPSSPSGTTVWVIHHFVAIVLLVYNVSYMTKSAFPAAVLLISGAGNIPNDLRWFVSALNVRRRAVSNLVLLLCAVIMFLVGAVPPPVLLYRAAIFLKVSVKEVFFRHMKFYCRFFFLFFYLPHLYLVALQVDRMYRNWNLPPPPFRIKSN